MTPHLDDASDRAFRPSFFFRQRYGKLDWKVIAHVQLEQIVADVDVKQLQHVLDPLAFSDIRPEDLPLFAPELVCKAFQLLQLLLEYSLNYAHTQQDLIQALREQNKDGKLHHNQLQNELRNVEEGNVALRRDLHRYHSFVHLCKRLLAAKSVDCDEALDELWLRAEADGGMLLLPYEHNLPRPPVSAHLCDRCHKAFCSTEFLRRHRQRRHGISPEDDEKGIAAPTPKAPAVDVAVLEEKIRSAVSQEMASVVEALRRELHKTREELGQRATAADAYKDLLERHKASLAEKEIELGKVKAERDWLQKEVEKVRRGVPAVALSQPTLDKEDVPSKKHKFAPATTLERLQPVVRHKSKLQMEGEKRKKARQLLKAYKCVYRDLRCAWYRWIAKTSARHSLVQSTRSASRSALMSSERIQALRERYGIATKTRPSTPPPPPSQPLLHAPPPSRLSLEEYLRDFERRVESTVRQQLGDAPVLKRGEEYDRQAVQEARQAVLAQLETNAHLLGVDVTQSFLRSLQLQEALSEQQPEQTLDPAATSLKAYLGSVLGAVEDCVDDFDGSAVEELQHVLHSYMEAVNDPSNQTVRFPADAVLTWLTEVQQQQTHQGEATSAEGVGVESFTPSLAHSLPWSPDHVAKQHVEETVHSISVDPRLMMSSGQESVAYLEPSSPLMSTPPCPEQRQDLPATEEPLTEEPLQAREEAASPYEPVFQVGPLQVQAPPPAYGSGPNPPSLPPQSATAAPRPSTPDMVSEGFDVDDGRTPAGHDTAHEEGATEGGAVTTPVTSPGPDAHQDITFTETVAPVDAPDAAEAVETQPTMLEERDGDILSLQSVPAPPSKPPRPTSAQPPDSPSDSTYYGGPPRKPARMKDEKAPTTHDLIDGRGIEQSPTPAPPEDQTTVAMEEPSPQEVKEASVHNMPIQEVEYLEVHGEHSMISPTSVRSFTPPPESPPSNARVGVQHQSRAEDSQEDVDLQVIEL